MAISSQKTIIVTGASRGIGATISKYLLRPSSGCNIVVVARNKASLQSLKHSYPDRVEVLARDLCNSAVGQEAVALAIKTFGRLDGVVVNHGVLEPVCRVGMSDVMEWKKAFDINFFSAVALLTAAIPYLRLAPDDGRIIFTSTASAVKPFISWGGYGASKAALLHLASTISLEEPRITTLSIIPGMVDTDMSTQLREHHLEAIEKADADYFTKLHANGQLLRPDQPGHVLARLVLGAGKHLDGQYLSWNDPTLQDFQERVEDSRSDRASGFTQCHKKIDGFA